MENSSSPREEGPGCLAIVPIFGGLGPEEMAEVAAITRERRFGKGETVYRAGREGKGLYVLHSGRVRISRIGPRGRSQVIRLLGAGEFMGELSVLNEAPLADYAEAVEETAMCIVEGPRLRALMEKYPSIAIRIMGELSARLERAEGLIEDISLHSAERRLAQALLELAGGKGEVELAQTKGDLASLLGMSQETLSRKLALFQERGLIGLRGRRRILVLDPEGLSEIE